MTFVSRFSHGSAAALLLLVALPRPAPAHLLPTFGDRPPTLSASLRRTDDPVPDEHDDDSDRQSLPPDRQRRDPEFLLSGPPTGQDKVTVMGNNIVGSDERLRGKAVTVMGNLTVDGEVANEVTVVMGNLTVNGLVGGDVAVVMGNLTLGPKARIGGNLACVAGHVEMAPTAVVRGRIVERAMDSPEAGARVGLESWLDRALRLGRPLAIGPHLGWLWFGTLTMIAVYALLGLIFPAGVRTAGELLIQRPALVIFTAVLSVLAVPVLFILLLVSVAGIPLAFLLPVAIMVAVIFGKASILALLGRRIAGNEVAPPLAVVVGSLVCLALYMVPILGLLTSAVLAGLGLGCAVTALFGAQRGGRLTGVPSPASGPLPGPAMPAPEPAPAPEPVPELAPEVNAVAASGVLPAAVSEPPVLAPTPGASALPPPLLNAQLPRAGFWIRMAALAIDAVLVGMIASALPKWREALVTGPRPGVHFTGGDCLLVLLPAYCVLLWKLRGATIGGIVCRLSVVRIDGRPVDWTTALVRGLGSYLSLACLGLGFIWVAFDEDRQSWHDKIAGTTVVRAPRGVSLV